MSSMLVERDTTLEVLKGSGLNVQIFDMEEARRIVRKRDAFAHKGSFGHALFIGGSKGKAGAAVLASRACMRAGAGMLTTLTTETIANNLATACPEAMTIAGGVLCVSEIEVDREYEGIGMGCGLGTSDATARALVKFLKGCKQPCVVDADALNIVAKEKEALHLVPKFSVITPHEREFERLAGETANYVERLKRAQYLSLCYDVYIVMKGHRTAIVCPEEEVWINTTGNAGMATAGSGDVLTGIILGLMAQGYAPKEAATLGVFVHGAAGDMVAKKQSEESLIASDIVEHIGEVYKIIHDKKVKR